MTRWIAATLFALFALVALTGPASSATYGARPRQAYTSWHWAAARYNSTSETLAITQSDPGARTFWAYQFAVGTNGGGYVGLQAGSHPYLTRTAIFSIWDADKAEGACAPFEGEGIGYSCRLDPYGWKLGRTYGLNVRVTSVDATGTWYTATVRDATTNVKHTIGRIHHPDRRAGVLGVGSWTERFGGAAATCATVARSTVIWGQPTHNDGRVKPTGHVNSTGPGESDTVSCPRSATSSNFGSGVVQQIKPT